MNQTDIEFQLAWRNLAHLTLTAGEAERMLSSLTGFVDGDELLDNLKHVQSAIGVGISHRGLNSQTGACPIESRLSLPPVNHGPPLQRRLRDAV